MRRALPAVAAVGAFAAAVSAAGIRHIPASEVADWIAKTGPSVLAIYYASAGIMRRLNTLEGQQKQSYDFMCVLLSWMGRDICTQHGIDLAQLRDANDTPGTTTARGS